MKNNLSKNSQNTKKTICHLIPNFIPGGAENQLKILVEEAFCYKHVIISIKDNKNIFEVSKLRNNFNGRIKVISLKFKLNPVSIIYSVNLLLKNINQASYNIGCIIHSF